MNKLLLILTFLLLTGTAFAVDKFKSDKLVWEGEYEPLIIDMITDKYPSCVGKDNVETYCNFLIEVTKINIENHCNQNKLFDAISAYMVIGSSVATTE